MSCTLRVQVKDEGRGIWKSTHLMTPIRNIDVTKRGDYVITCLACGTKVHISVFPNKRRGRPTFVHHSKSGGYTHVIFYNGVGCTDIL